jgi:hypothetical protein
MISTSMAANRRGRTRPPFKLVTCVHEAGHAVARLALDELCGIPGPILKEVTAEPREGYLGQTRQDSRAALLHHGGLDAYPPEVREGAAFRARLDVIETWAGLAAEVWHGDRSCFIFLKPNMLLAPETLTVDAIIARGDPVSDSESARLTLRGLGLEGEAAEAENWRLWWAAVVLVMAEWQGIKAAAAVLREHGTMGGADFEEVWRAARERPEKRQSRWDKLGAKDPWYHQQAAMHGVSYQGGLLVLPF